MKLKILLIDDEPDRHAGLGLQLRSRADILVRDPSDVSLDDIADVDLVSVDEYLGAEWAYAVSDGHLSGPVSLRNEDGLAVAAALRSQARSSERDYGVTLHTGELARLAAGLPARGREPLTAAQHDLDWVFSYGDDRFGERLLELAKAVRSAAAARLDIQADFGAAWLRLSGSAWERSAREQIEDCRPPAHALAENTRGRSYIRWLAQRILPYPTFLLDDSHGANLLGITEESFVELVAQQVIQDLAVSYSGPLNGFYGRRWWRAGLQFLLTLAGAEPWDTAQDRAAAVAALVGQPLQSLQHDFPVVTYDEEGVLLRIDANPSDAVRLQADGWPIFADDAWAEISRVQTNDRLLRLVALSERSRIPLPQPENE